MTLSALRDSIRADHRADERLLVRRLMKQYRPDGSVREAAEKRAAQLVYDLRHRRSPRLMEAFLAEYGLSTEEGVALMCLAEALLRVPDAKTIDALISEKITGSSWGEHRGHSRSHAVNASTWGLMLTGGLLSEKNKHLHASLSKLTKRLGAPVIRRAVLEMMKILGQQFVLGQTIEDATRRAAVMEKKGYTYSYDMLGEAAMTAQDAERYFQTYKHALTNIARDGLSSDIRQNPGISIKLSALHPRYEYLQRGRVLKELVPKTQELVRYARVNNIGINIDAEEADRLDLSLDVIEHLLSDEKLAGWDGFGVVVQAYSRRAPAVIDWLYALAKKLDRKIMVRLVKGAYWDTEIKGDQVTGVADYSVFTRKSFTDVSYICCARKLLSMVDTIYPQFATHNAHTIAAILEERPNKTAFEFQMLHGMGENLHALVKDAERTSCRIYAPVGPHRDLLAYLVRRLLENGANSSFVHAVVDHNVPIEEVVRDPFIGVEQAWESISSFSLPPNIYMPQRQQAKGWDLNDPSVLKSFEQSRAPFMTKPWSPVPLMNAQFQGCDTKEIINPADPNDVCGSATDATSDDVSIALDDAAPWTIPLPERSEVLREAAYLYEQNHGELFAALTREAGKSALDAVAELREAVDFLRFYAGEAEGNEDLEPRGVVACISPWNFPLAIFTGQIAAALAAGNAVLAKPAEETPVIAWLAVQLLWRAGVPRNVLQLLPGPGHVVGAKIVSDPRIEAVCFTGSTETAQTIHRTLARHASPNAALIAETGGINAMVIDSTALPEQAVRDVIESAFQSAGQRCSALRILYLQEDIFEPFREMLYAAMDELVVGSPADTSVDVGPVISIEAKQAIDAYIEQKKSEGCLEKQIDAPDQGNFVKPSVIRVGGISDIEREIFGPVLHLATFKGNELDRIVEEINASGYGLTFAIHSRLNERINDIVSSVCVGNIYANRNQIGAVVQSQPFGGEGLSGTGPKAGGPRYLPRFFKSPRSLSERVEAPLVDAEAVQRWVDALVRPDQLFFDAVMPGPTGESNRLYTAPRGIVLCLGPTLADAQHQAREAEAVGCRALIVAPGASEQEGLDGLLDRVCLQHLKGFDAVALFSDDDDLRAARIALAERDGPLLPLISERNVGERCIIERHVCVDTTAAGGNAELLAANSA